MRKRIRKIKSEKEEKRSECEKARGEREQIYEIAGRDEFQFYVGNKGRRNMIIVTVIQELDDAVYASNVN